MIISLYISCIISFLIGFAFVFFIRYISTESSFKDLIASFLGGMTFSAIGCLLYLLIGIFYVSYEINTLNRKDLRKIIYFDTEKIWFNEVIINNTNHNLYIFHTVYYNEKYPQFRGRGENKIVKILPAYETTVLGKSFPDYWILSSPSYASTAYEEYHIVTKEQIDEFLDKVQ